MILDTTHHNLKYISVDRGSYSRIKGSNLTSLDQIVRAEKFGHSPDDYRFYNTYTRWENKNPYYSSGIYLASSIELTKAIEGKKYCNNITNIKSVYFDKECKYPRFKLNTFTNIKRRINPAKADACIVSPKYFAPYPGGDSSTSYYTGNQVLILFSKKELTHYFIDYFPRVSDSYRPYIQNIMKSLVPTIEYTLDCWSKILIKAGILPEDCEKFYEGEVVMLDNKEIRYLNDLFERYPTIIYDTDIDKMVNNGLSALTDSDIQSIEHMLSSQDQSVVSMGLKLLSNYDLSKHVCSIGMLIIRNWSKIYMNPTSTSVGFEHVLHTLGLSRKNMNWWNTRRLINDLYKHSTNDEDKNRARNIIKSELYQEIREYLNTYGETKYSAFGFKINFSIE